MAGATRAVLGRGRAVALHGKRKRNPAASAFAPRAKRQSGTRRRARCSSQAKGALNGLLGVRSTGGGVGTLRREPMSFARVAIFDEAPLLHDDDERRAQSLRELLQSARGFIAGYDLREEATGRLMSVTLWESEAALEAGERAVRNRPVSDQRGIRPSRIERWVIDASF
jgi:heme-degrading monooxygenase HmoA